MSCASAAIKTPRVIFISGPSNSGKTTLIEQLVPRLRQTGLHIGTVKHAHHGYQLDQPGKDSARHAEAGADAVTIIGPQETAFLLKTETALDVSDVIAKMKFYTDVILIEGFKQHFGPRIQLGKEKTDALRIEGEVCTLGGFPDRLSSSEWEQLIQFCLLPRIMVRVLCFAQMKEQLGQAEYQLFLPQGARSGEVRASLLGNRPFVEPLLKVSRLAVNGVYASNHLELHEGDEVAIIPPVSGG